MKKFDKDKNYYEILGVEPTATQDEIQQAFETLMAELYNQKINATTQEEKDRIDNDIESVKEAINVLGNEAIRNKYDKARGSMVKVEGSEEAEKTGTKASSIIKKVGAGTLAAAILLGVGYGLGSCSSKKGQKQSPVPGTTTVSSSTGISQSSNNPTSITSTTSTSTTIVTSTTGNSDDDDKIQGLPGAGNRNYGDITNDEEVTEKAQGLLDEINKANLFNLSTGLPYSVDEIKNILLYMNGAYVPENKQDVYDMYTEFLNFVCLPLNMEAFVYQVNYMGGEESFKDIIDENAKHPVSFDLAHAATFGNAYGAEYVEWLQEQYFALLYTTDEKKYNSIYTEVWQSFADIMKGNGYTIQTANGQMTITEQSLLMKDNIGIANQISFWLLNFEPYRNTKTTDSFSVTQKYLSADPNEQIDTVSIDEMFAYINAVCDEEAIGTIDYAVDDNGNSLDTMKNGIPGETWGMRTQENTKAKGLELLASKGYTLSKRN